MLAGVKLATHRWQLLGPALFLVLYLTPTGALEGTAKTVAAAIVWMAVWWVSGAAPLAVTSLLPLVLFPLLGVRPACPQCGGTVHRDALVCPHCRAELTPFDSPT